MPGRPNTARARGRGGLLAAVVCAVAGLAVVPAGPAAAAAPPTQLHQAENAQVSGASRARDRAGYTGTGFVDFVADAGGWAQWQVHTKAAGRYMLSWRYANGGTTRPVGLDLDGRRVATVPMVGTRSWTVWRETSRAVMLPKGVSTVRITTLGNGGANVDRMTVTAVRLPPPRPVGLYEAESATRTAASVATNRRGYTGRGFVDFAADRAGYVQWTVSAPRAGSYLLTWRYSNGSTQSRPMQLSVNGAPRARVVNQPTGSFDRWALTSSATQLTKGLNTIRLASTEVNGPNIDHLKVALRSTQRAGTDAAGSTAATGGWGGPRVPPALLWTALLIAVLAVGGRVLTTRAVPGPAPAARAVRRRRPPPVTPYQRRRPSRLRVATVVVLSGTVALTGLGAVPAQAGQPAIGSFDGFFGPTISGWALDPDSPETRLAVHVYVDGAFYGAAVADQPRPDVAGLRGTSGHHGWTLPYNPGSGRVVKVYAIGIDPGAAPDGQNPQLGGSPRTPGDFSPVGYLDTADNQVVSGWALDLDHPAPVAVHIYVNDQFYAAATADQPRPDVAAVYDTTGAHGFSVPFTLPGGSHKVVVHAIGHDGGGAPNGDNPALTNSGVLTPAPPPPPLPPAGNEGTVNGTAGGDTVIGTTGQDALFGYGGNDTLIGNSAHGAKGEQLDGGDGNDVLIACSTGDRAFTAVRGGSGHDIAFVEPWAQSYRGDEYDFVVDVEEVYACGGTSVGGEAIGYPINPQFERPYPAGSVAPQPASEGGVVLAWSQDAWGAPPFGLATGQVVRDEGMLLAGQPNAFQRGIVWGLCSLGVTCEGGGPAKLAPYTPSIKTPGGAPIETISPGTGGLRTSPGGAPPGPRNGFPAYTVPNGGRAPYIGPAGGGCGPAQCNQLLLQLETGFFYAGR